MEKDWERYERVVRMILDSLRDHLGYSRVEGKQKYPGKCGTDWEIDATAYEAGNEQMVLVECRRYTTSKINQESMGAFAYRITDTGAAGGLIVTPVGFQEGAKRVAADAKIRTATLNLDATERDYDLDIAGRLFFGREMHGGVRLGGSGPLQVEHYTASSGGFSLGGSASVGVTYGRPPSATSTQRTPAESDPPATENANGPTEER